MRFSYLIGLLILFRIGLLIYFVVIGGDYMYPDSPMYIELASNLLENHVFSMSPTPPYVPHVFRTPGYPAFLAAFQYFGLENSYWIVLAQELIYAVTIAIFYYFGKGLFDKNIIRGGLIFLLLDPSGFAYPKILLTEVLFLPFLILGILLIGHYLKQNNTRYLLVAGLVMGLGAIVRPGIIYLPLVIAITLIAFDFRNKKKWLHAGMLVLVFTIIFSPWLIRNYYHFGKVFTSGIQSYTIANYHVPMVWELFKGLPQSKSQAIVHNKINLQIKQQEKQLGRPLSRVEFFLTQQSVAVKELAKMPAAYGIAFLYGIMKTMNGPNIIELYDILEINVDRPRLFQVISEKGYAGIFHYFLNIDFLFLLNSIITILMTGLALLGAFKIVKSKNCFLWIMMLANFYFISTPGPMGEARFRFPIGVFWFIQAYLGWRWLAALTIQWHQTYLLKTEKYS